MATKTKKKPSTKKKKATKKKSNIKKSDFELRGLKTFIGREGHGFNANLFFRGKKVAFTYDDASGGPVDIDFTDPNGPIEKEINAWVKEQPKIKHPACPEVGFKKAWTSEFDLEAFVNMLVDKGLEGKRRERNEKRILRANKTRIVYSLKKYKPGEYMRTGPYKNEATRLHWLKQLKKEHGKKITFLDDAKSIKKFLDADDEAQKGK